MQKKLKNIVAIIIAVSGFLFQVGLQSAMRPYAKDGFYFQGWSSETMMQTVSIIDLQDDPVETLYNIHIQPPGLDLIRAFFVYVWPNQDPNTALLNVDYLLYKLWALLYGLLGLIVFLWLHKLTKIKFAIIATIAFLLHPACLFYATLLDGTILTSLLILLFYYLLWKIKNNYDVTPALVVFSILALFFTRSIFQFPFVMVAGFSFFLTGMPKQKILLILLITGSVIGLYTTKQYYQFGIASTTSFTGLNLNNSIGNQYMTEYRGYLKSINHLSEQENKLPRTLTRTEKANGAVNFNNIKYLQLNQELIEQYKEHLVTTPLSQIIMSYHENLTIYFQPSSRYTSHVIVDRIPWRSFYDQLFSFPVLILLILFLGTSWLIKVIKRRDYIASIGLVLPGLYIFLATILFEKGENNRFKFFLEPVLFVFMVSQLFVIGQHIYERALSKRAVDGGDSVH